MGTQAAIGVRDHSGWAALVAIAGDVAAPEVVHRRRISLLAPGMASEPYHAVVGMPVEAARARVREAFDGARQCARVALSDAIDELGERGFEVVAAGCGVSVSPVRMPLERVLKAHPMLHASEGELFRDAIAEAAGELRLAVSRAPWKELWTQLQAELGGVDARERVSAMKASLGAPWAADQKEACAAAWLALATFVQDA